jgi:CheY-like chemotaxis protein
MEKEEINKLKEHTQNLNLLFVEDALDICEMYHFFFDELFENVYESHNGLEALAFLKQEDKKIDLIITDQFMPEMNGIEMVKNIREFNQKIPIILVTATQDHKDLIDAINLKVTSFVAKPVNYTEMMKAVSDAIQSVLVEQLFLKTKEQELEILKYKNAYSSFQEEEAFKKQLNIIKNDYFYKLLVNDTNNSIYRTINYFYKPKDTLSGDTFSIRQLSNDEVFMFIIDAMGKGVSASVSTINSTSFINYLFEKMVKENNFHLENLIKQYVEFIRFELLEDEIVSALFVTLNTKTDRVKISSFSMPPVLALNSKTGEVEKISKNNMPINSYIDQFKTTERSISSFSKILFFSDGLAENTTKDGVQYLDYISEDFKKARTKTDFVNTFFSRIDEQEDDTTIIFYSKRDLNLLKKEQIKVETSMDSIAKASEFLTNTLDEMDVGIKDQTMFEQSFTELIMNAYEHGNLGIGFRQKQQLMGDGEYFDYILEKEIEASDKYIDVNFYTSDRAIFITITDEGKGFDTNILKDLMNHHERFHGRGIKMSNNSLDFVYYNQVGNSVFFGKTFKK